MRMFEVKIKVLVLTALGILFAAAMWIFSKAVLFEAYRNGAGAFIWGERIFTYLLFVGSILYYIIEFRVLWRKGEGLNDFNEIFDPAIFSAIVWAMIWNAVTLMSGKKPLMRQDVCSLLLILCTFFSLCTSIFTREWIGLKLFYIRRRKLSPEEIYNIVLGSRKTELCVAEAAAHQINDGQRDRDIINSLARNTRFSEIREYLIPFMTNKEAENLIQDPKANAEAKAEAVRTHDLSQSFLKEALYGSPIKVAKEILKKMDSENEETLDNMAKHWDPDIYETAISRLGEIEISELTQNLINELSEELKTKGFNYDAFNSLKCLYHNLRGKAQFDHFKINDHTDLNHMDECYFNRNQEFHYDEEIHTDTTACLTFPPDEDQTEKEEN